MDQYLFGGAPCPSLGLPMRACYLAKQLGDGVALPMMAKAVKHVVLKPGAELLLKNFSD
jgi:hypothetical protein